METRVILRYAGPAVEAGAMDVYEATANMLAFSEFVVEISKRIFGDDVQTNARVVGFQKGSFVTGLDFNVVGAAASIFSVVTPNYLWEIFRECIDCWKFLKGSPPAVTKYNGNTVAVENNNGEIKQFNINSLNIVFSERASESVEQFVRKALERPGMDSIEIANDSGTISEVTQKESSYFRAVVPQETVTDVTVTMTLILEAPVFKEANKWRFSDGQQSFYADMEDKEFLARVDSGEAFRKGDIMRVDVRLNQQKAGLKLTAERSVVKVYDHKSGSRQLPLQ